MPVILCGRSDGGSQEDLLLFALSHFCGLDILPPIARKGRGKPWFPDFPQFHFNLSDSGQFILCAVSDVSVGVDLECFRVRSPNLPRHILNDREFAWFESRGSRWEDFFTLWTLKESRCKCTGQGLNVRPSELPVPLLDPGEQGSLDGFFFRSFGGEDWRAAVCTMEDVSLPESILWPELPLASFRPVPSE